MKSLKTLIISAAVCGAMALPLSSLASGCSGGCSCGANHGKNHDHLDSAIATVMKACHDPNENEVKKKCKKLVKILNHHGGKD